MEQPAADSTDAKKEDDAMKVNKKTDAKMEDDAMKVDAKMVPMPRRPLLPGEPGFRHGTFSMASGEFETSGDPDSEYHKKAAAKRQSQKDAKKEDDDAMKVNAKMTDAKKEEDDTMKDAKKKDDDDSMDVE